MESYIGYIIVVPLLFLAGFVDSIAGGGGLISLPAYFLAGLPPHTALGTNKFSNCMGTAIATARFYMNGYIKGALAAVCALLSFLGSTAGSRLALMISSEVFEKLMIVILPLVAFYVLRDKKLSSSMEEDEPVPDRRAWIISCLCAFFIGGYDGFYGPGTGTFLLLLLTGWAHLGIRTSAGLKQCINLASNAAALVTFILSGNVYYPLGLAGAAANIAGNYLGAGMVMNNAQKVVKPIIIVVLTLLFIKILSGR